MRAIDLDDTWSGLGFPAIFNNVPEIFSDEAELLDVKISKAEVKRLIRQYAHESAEISCFCAWCEQVGSSEMRMRAFAVLRTRQLAEPAGLDPGEVEAIWDEEYAKLEFPDADYQGDEGASESPTSPSGGS